MSLIYEQRAVRGRHLFASCEMPNYCIWLTRTISSHPSPLSPTAGPQGALQFAHTNNNNNTSAQEQNGGGPRQLRGQPRTLRSMLQRVKEAKANAAALAASSATANGTANGKAHTNNRHHHNLANGNGAEHNGAWSPLLSPELQQQQRGTTKGRKRARTTTAEEEDSDPTYLPNGAHHALKATTPRKRRNSKTAAGGEGEGEGEGVGAVVVKKRRQRRAASVVSDSEKRFACDQCPMRFPHKSGTSYILCVRALQLGHFECGVPPLRQVRHDMQAVCILH